MGFEEIVLIIAFGLAAILFGFFIYWSIKSIFDGGKSILPIFYKEIKVGSDESWLDLYPCKYDIVLMRNHSFIVETRYRGWAYQFAYANGRLVRKSKVKKGYFQWNGLE